MTMEPQGLDGRVKALLDLERSTESLDRVQDIITGVPKAAMPELIDAFTRRAWIDDHIAVSDRAGRIHDRLVGLSDRV